MNASGRILFALIALLWIALGAALVARFGDQACTARWDRCQ